MATYAGAAQGAIGPEVTSPQSSPQYGILTTILTIVLTTILTTILSDLAALNDQARQFPTTGPSSADPEQQPTTRPDAQVRAF